MNSFFKFRLFVQWLPGFRHSEFYINAVIASYYGAQAPSPLTIVPTDKPLPSPLNTELHSN